MKKIPYLKIMCCVILAYIAAFVTEFMFTLDYRELVEAAKCTQPERIVGIEESELVGCTFSDGRLIADDQDPQIIIRGLNCQIDTVQLRVRDISSSALNLQLFYTDNVPFSEENSLRDTLTENEYVKNIEIKQFATDVRIDIGDSPDVSYIVDEIIINPHLCEYLYGHVGNMSRKRVALFFAAWIVVLMMSWNYRMFVDLLFRHRWSIGVVVILAATVLKLHGSSIGFIVEQFTGTDPSRLFGISRPIRSDEYAVFTQMALAQTQSGFKWFSDIWGFSPSDMFIVYGQPVKNIMTIFRPFSLGFLFLGAERGIAFYWSARQVVLFLVSFEFGRMISKDDRRLSFLYGVMVAFAPLVQWWFSINELVEMLVFGQAAILLMFLYLSTEKIIKKCVAAMGIFVCIVGYALTLYPAWMIPLAYVFMACLIAMLIEKKHSIKFRKYDICIVLLEIIILALCAYYIWNRSGDTIQKVTNTIYPGKRFYYGGPGEVWIKLFMGWTSWLWSFVDIVNPCEEVCFISLFPIGIIFSLVILIKKGIRDSWMISLNICNLFLMAYTLFEMPELIGSITLLNHSSPRIINAIGFLNLILFIRSFKLLEFSKKKNIFAVLIGVIISAFSVLGAGHYLTPALKGIVVLVIVVTVYLIFSSDNQCNKFGVMCWLMGLCVIGGTFINPVQSGLSDLYDLQDIQNIKVVNDSEEGLWLVNGEAHYLTNLPTVVGAHTLTATATYPDTMLWKKLGLENEEDIWNRYAYLLSVIDQKTYLEMIQSDVIRLHITLEDAKNLGVKYVWSLQDISSINGIRQVKNHIYKVD